MPTYHYHTDGSRRGSGATREDSDDGNDCDVAGMEERKEQKEGRGSLVLRRSISARRDSRITPIQTLPAYSARLDDLSSSPFSSASPTLSALGSSPSSSPSPSPPLPPPRPPLSRTLSAALTAASYWSVRRGAVGLVNLGNSCYFDSAVQCLLSIPPLLAYFGAASSPSARTYHADVNEKTKSKGAFAHAFAQLCSTVASASPSSPSSLSPSTLLRLFTTLNPSFAGYGQHDSQECIRCFLSSLHDDVNRVRVVPAYVQLEDVKGEREADQARRWWQNYCERNDSVVVDLFAGQLRSEVRCEQCRQASICFDPFLDLSLPLPVTARSSPASSSFPFRRRQRYDSDASPQTLSLADCLQAFTTAESLSGDDCMYCRSCKAHTPCTKTLSVHRLPHVLVLHLKRFSYDARTGARRKVEVDVDFPMEMDVRESGGDGGVYELMAVSNHMGSTGGGHYVAHGRVDKEWWEFNDSRARPMKESDLRDESAYVLFYQRRPLKTSSG